MSLFEYLEAPPSRDLLKKALRKLAEQKEVYLTGGALRDILSGRKVKDLDLLVLGLSAEVVARELSRELSWTLVPLHEAFGVFRVACGSFAIDVSGLRPGAASLEEDLRLRDFTLNALAVSLREVLEKPPAAWSLIDPCGGFSDLSQGLIRAISEDNLREDPLRILRAYRFQAQGYGTIEGLTRKIIWKVVEELKARELLGVAPERVQSELFLILASERAGEVIVLMEDDGVLPVIFPELEEGRGIPQPDFHHLDVLGHGLETLRKLEEILNSPERYFRERGPFEGVKDSQEIRVALKLAGLFHDAGKARTFSPAGERADRITFYEHEKVGAEMFAAWAERLRWKRALIKKVQNLIRHHMRPFFLLEVWLEGRLTARAKRRLIRDCPDYPELFLLALADCLAARGPASDETHSKKLVELFWEIHQFAQEVVSKVARERLITGHDLIEIFGLKPGPIFREILAAVEEAQVEGRIRTREEALAWLKEYLKPRA